MPSQAGQYHEQKGRIFGRGAARRGGLPWGATARPALHFRASPPERGEFELPASGKAGKGKDVLEPFAPHGFHGVRGFRKTCPLAGERALPWDSCLSGAECPRCAQVVGYQLAVWSCLSWAPSPRRQAVIGADEHVSLGWADGMLRPLSARSAPKNELR
jgi:hypothetical protein